MKTRYLAMTLALIGLLLLSACGAGAAPAGQAAGGQAPGAQGTPGARQPGSPSQAIKLALGTLKLEGTANAVSAEQAAALLPLWKAVRSLNKSENSAAQEVQGIFRQIEKEMTSEQMTAIDAMQLDMANMQTIAKELGIELGGPNSNGDPGIQATMQAARATAQAGGETMGGGGPGGMGGPPGMMGGGPGMGDPGMDSSLSDEAKATAMARSSGRGAQIGLPAALVDAVIKALQAHTSQ